jgi:hypothetical protein
MSLLEAPAETPNKRRAAIFTTVALLLVGAVLLWFTFRYYPEKKAAENFFDALVAGDTSRAYQLWKPLESYKMQDFLADWGPAGYYGPVKSYEIRRTESPLGANTVKVTVAISPFSPMPDGSDAEKSRKTRIVAVEVISASKALSFPRP